MPADARGGALADASIEAAQRCLDRSALAASTAEAPWDGFSGLIPTAEDEGWGEDAPRHRPTADPVSHPPMGALVRELASAEAAAMERAFGPARVLISLSAAVDADGTRPPAGPSTSSTSSPADLEAAAVAALDAGDVAGAVAALRAAADACGGVENSRAAARIARYLAAAEGVLRQQEEEGGRN